MLQRCSESKIFNTKVKRDDGTADNKEVVVGPLEGPWLDEGVGGALREVGHAPGQVGIVSGQATPTQIGVFDAVATTEYPLLLIEV